MGNKMMDFWICNNNSYNFFYILLYHSNNKILLKVSKIVFSNEKIWQSYKKWVWYIIKQKHVSWFTRNTPYPLIIYYFLTLRIIQLIIKVLMTNHQEVSSFIWNVCDDVLRGLFKPHEYGDVILPFVVLRRLDCVLEPDKDKVYQLFTQYNCLYGFRGCEKRF